MRCAASSPQALVFREELAQRRLEAELRVTQFIKSKNLFIMGLVFCQCTHASSPALSATSKPAGSV